MRQSAAADRYRWGGRKSMPRPNISSATSSIVSWASSSAEAAFPCASICAMRPRTFRRNADTQHQDCPHGQKNMWHKSARMMNLKMGNAQRHHHISHRVPHAETYTRSCCMNPQTTRVRLRRACFLPIHFLRPLPLRTDSMI